MPEPQNNRAAEPARRTTARARWRTRLSPLVNRELVLMVWLPVLVITIFHYVTPHQHQWVHDILRRTYYLPIVIAALRTGWTGGLFTALIVSAAYLPHAFFAEHHFDPARGLEKVLEIVLYLVVASVAGVLSDAERRRNADLQQALEAQRLLAHQLARSGRLTALGEVVAGIAHEIKNPLHSLLGTAEIVSSLVPEEAEERAMWDIHVEEIHRLERIAERFLSFARPTKVEKQNLDLRDVAVRIADLISAQARKSGIEVATRTGPDNVSVRGDLDQLAQVGLNIALNGIKAIGDGGGRLTITTRPETTDAGLTVAALAISNTGPPIPDDGFDRLFDPFYSGSDGTGLGLAISARIADAHDGSLDAKNTSEGVVFTLRIPIADDSSEGAQRRVANR